MRRVATPEAMKDGIGGWRIMCADCPLLPHLNALVMEAKPCASGISTRMQGAITIHKCEHYETESISADENKVVTLECKKEVTP